MPIGYTSQSLIPMLKDLCILLVDTDSLPAGLPLHLPTIGSAAGTPGSLHVTFLVLRIL